VITAVWPPGNCNRFLSRSPSLVAVAWPRCMCNWVVLFVGFFECFPLFSYVSYVSYVLWCLTVCSVCSVLLSLLWFSSVLFLGGLVCIGFGWFRLIWSFLFLGYLVWVWRRLGIQDHSVMDCKGPFSILMIDSGMELTLSKLLTNGCPSLPYVPSFLSFVSFFFALFLPFFHYIQTTKFAWSCIQRLRKCNWCLTTVLADFQHSQSNFTSMMRTSTHSSGGSWTMQENMTIWPNDDPGLSRFWLMTNHDWLPGGFKHVLRSPNLWHDDPIWVA
jgi:hypothetical protein